jgi:hypothetical protein
MVGNARGIVEGVKRVRRARNHVDRSRREQGNSYQRGSDPRDARYALLRWFQFLVPLCLESSLTNRPRPRASVIVLWPETKAFQRQWRCRFCD